MRTTLPLLAVLACSSPVDVAGDWTGSARCDGADIPVTMTLAETEDDDEASGDGLVAFTASDGTDVSVSFDIELSWTAPSGGVAAMTADFTNCEEASIGPILCWTADALEFDVEDQELTGSLSGFVVNDGECDWSMEVSGSAG